MDIFFQLLWVSQWSFLPLSWAGLSRTSIVVRASLERWPGFQLLELPNPALLPDHRWRNRFPSGFSVLSTLGSPVNQTVFSAAGLWLALWRLQSVWLWWQPSVPLPKPSSSLSRSTVQPNTSFSLTQLPDRFVVYSYLVSNSRVGVTCISLPSSLHSKLCNGSG